MKLQSVLCAMWRYHSRGSVSVWPVHSERGVEREKAKGQLYSAVEEARKGKLVKSRDEEHATLETNTRRSRWHECGLLYAMLAFHGEASCATVVPG